ncbi:MAG: mammalian cell entry protein [Mycobacterium sp.]|uniref:mammalian cell entry protein n=1 Tax=Mycobacterium sp. TaxID=1785 RepID=UPI003BB6FA90
MPDDAAVSGGEPHAPVDVVYFRPIQPASQVERIALVVGLISGAVLAGLVGWLSFRTYEVQNREAQRDLFVQTAQQVAVNLSTVDYQNADADAQRILDSATGKFADNFSHRKQLYIDAAKRTRSKSLGAVTDAGLESQTGDQGRVLVSVTVKSADPAQAQQEPQFVRMRLTVRKIGDIAKVSDVAFLS